MTALGRATGIELVGSCVDTMKDQRKTKKQLIEELEAERKRSAGADASGLERQLAGERVRQEIWRMDSSEDTEQLLQAISLSLRALEIPLMHLGVNVIDTGTSPATVITHSMAPSGEWRRTAGAVASNVLKFWEGRKIVYRPDVSRDDPYDEYEHFQGRVNAVVDVPFSHGTLAVSSKVANAFSQEDLVVLGEMASHLSDGFRRLDDLRVLEERNRELETEVADRRLREKQSLAIAPVREAVWNMTGTSDVVALLAALRASLELLEVRFTACGLNLLNDPVSPTSWQAYNLDKEEQWARPVIGARISVIIEFWQRGEPTYRRDLARDDPFHERQHLSGTYGDIRSVLDIPFSHGTLALNSSEPDAFDEWQIVGLTRLATVLSEGFRRRDDLQALEQRNEQLENEIGRRERRELLQAARHRVREQVWQMADAGDIDRVLTAIAEALKSLDVVFDFCGVNVLDAGAAGSALATIYVTRWDGEWSRREAVLDSPTVLAIWRSGKPSYRADLRADDPYGEGASFKTVRCLLDVPFSLGTLALSSSAPDAFSEQDIDVLQNMAGLLSEGFQRMADLQALYGAMEEAKQAAEVAEAANRAKSAFLANMSHELRTPLTAILGFTQVLRRSEGLTDEQLENVQIVNRSGEHLLTLINDILEMSRIEAGHMTLQETVFNPHAMLDSLAEMFDLRAQSKGLHLTCEAASDVPKQVRTDESKLRQILINLLSNAVKFTEEGDVAVRMTCDDCRLSFEVADSGPGIAPEEQEGLFNAFVQTATGKQVQEGTGLGLAISQQFARLLGGEIAVQSGTGGGAIFRFDVPFIQPDEGEQVQAAGPLRRVTGLMSGQPEYRILVVEDREQNRLLIRQLMESLGLAVKESVDGEAGIAQWEAWQPHLIWMDMRMPGMDGYEATRRIKATAQGQKTKVIALTASAFKEDRDRVMAAGCDDFVRKPFCEEELWGMLERHLRMRFTYEEAGEGAAGGENLGSGTKLTTGELAVLPDRMVAALHQAAMQADDEAMRNLLAQVDGEHAELVQNLSELVRDFRFDDIMTLTVRTARDT